MLKLSTASRYFDRTEVLDAYDRSFICFGQVDPYDDSKRDAVAAYRRVLSVAPGTELPEHAAVEVLGTTWLVGRLERDGLREPHRDKFVLHPAPERFRAGSITEYLLGYDADDILMSAEPVKTGKESESSSDVVAFFDLYSSRASRTPKNSLVWAEDVAYLVLMDRVLPSGLRAAYSVRLDSTRSDAILTTREFDPVAGVHADGSVEGVQVLRVRWQSLFEYFGQLDPKFREGDDVLVFPSGTSVSTSSVVEVDGKAWGVKTVSLLGGAVTAHVRPR